MSTACADDLKKDTGCILQYSWCIRAKSNLRPAVWYNLASLNMPSSCVGTHNVVNAPLTLWRIVFMRYDTVPVPCALRLACEFHVILDHLPVNSACIFPAEATPDLPSSLSILQKGMLDLVGQTCYNLLRLLRSVAGHLKCDKTSSSCPQLDPVQLLEFQKHPENFLEVAYLAFAQLGLGSVADRRECRLLGSCRHDEDHLLDGELDVRRCPPLPFFHRHCDLVECTATIFDTRGHGSFGVIHQNKGFDLM